MKTNKLIYFLLAGLLVAGLSSCNDFLDEQPDNRTIIDSEEKAIRCWYRLMRTASRGFSSKWLPTIPITTAPITMLEPFLAGEL